MKGLQQQVTSLELERDRLREEVEKMDKEVGFQSKVLQQQVTSLEFERDRLRDEVSAM